MRVLIKYLLYENLLSYGVWQADEGEAAAMRGDTVQMITTLSPSTCINEDTRWNCSRSSHATRSSTGFPARPSCRRC